MSRKDGPLGMRRMGEKGKSSGRARIALSPPGTPRGIGCRRMMGIDGGIMVNRHRAIRPSFLTLIADGRPYFLRHFHEAAGPALVCLIMVDIDPAVSATRGRKSGPVNWREMARDSRGYWHEDIMANRHRAGRPSFRAQIEADDPYFRRLYRAAARGPGAKKKWAIGGISIRD